MKRVFGWPEPPPPEVIAAMERLLACDAVVSRGYDLSYAEVTEVLKVAVQPTHEPMDFAAQ